MWFNDDPTPVKPPMLMDVLAANAKEQRKAHTITAIHLAFPHASRQHLVVLLQKEGWNNYDIIEILEGIGGEDIL